MEHNIIITDSIKKQILDYYSKLNTEAICVVFLCYRDNCYFTTRFMKFSDDDYKFQNFKTVCLKAEITKMMIDIANKEHVDMLLIIHNHTVFLPYLSKDDKKAMQKITAYLRKKGIPIIHGVGVYTCGMLTLCIDFSEGAKRKYYNLRRKTSE